MNVRSYALVVSSYWAFTLTDGALRMLVVLHFHSLGYSALAIASLFLFYELFGVITNLVGGWLGARIGLNRTMHIGMFMQVLALAMLTVDTQWLTVTYVMAAQALSGIAKDLNKMSAKSSIKFLVNQKEQGRLFKWIAILTGSKNALKGAGFFLGGLLLSTLGFAPALSVLAAGLLLIAVISLCTLRDSLGKASKKRSFTQLFSHSRNINRLSLARFFLFAARDVWFVVALPVYFQSELGWDHWLVGAYLATWVIGYGLVQAVAPVVIRRFDAENSKKSLQMWSGCLTTIPFVAYLGLELDFSAEVVLFAGLLIYGTVFAINSALHSYLVVAWSERDSVSHSVGFYYMSNAAGRLVGTVLSGAVYVVGGLEVCLVISALFLLICTFISRQL